RVHSRPKIDATPDTPKTEAAAIFATPRSMAWATMWKMGPEWAAQQAKWVSAIVQNGPLLSAVPAVWEGAGVGAAPASPWATAPTSCGLFRMKRLGGGRASHPR